MDTPFGVDPRLRVAVKEFLRTIHNDEVTIIIEPKIVFVFIPEENIRDEISLHAHEFFNGVTNFEIKIKARRVC